MIEWEKTREKFCYVVCFMGGGGGRAPLRGPDVALCLRWCRPVFCAASCPPTGFLTSLSIETIQLFIDRGTDLDDLILNTVGASGGYLLYRLLRAAVPGFATKFTCVKV